LPSQRSRRADNDGRRCATRRLSTQIVSVCMCSCQPVRARRCTRNSDDRRRSVKGPIHHQGELWRSLSLLAQTGTPPTTASSESGSEKATHAMSRARTGQTTTASPGSPRSRRRLGISFRTTRCTATARCPLSCPERRHPRPQPRRERRATKRLIGNECDTDIPVCRQSPTSSGVP
jgi:hypothetical protein